MLELRPNCECCDKDLPPHAADARICTYECTFCAHCAETVLLNVCPNCGGGFVPRPIRPVTERRPGVCRTKRATSAITGGGATPDFGGDAATDAFATAVIAALQALIRA